MKPFRVVIAGAEYEIRGGEVWHRGPRAARFARYWPVAPKAGQPRHESPHRTPADVLRWLCEIETREIERERDALEQRHRAVNVARQQLDAWRTQ